MTSAGTDGRQWFSLRATGTTRQRWFKPMTDGPMRDETWQHLCRVGLDGLAQPVWFQQVRDHRGTVWCDVLWDTSACGVTIVSE